MMATCCTCGVTFHRAPDETWKRRCLPCWRASKGRTEPEADIDALLDAQYKLGYAAGLAAATLDKAKMRELLQLVHPDRHGGSALATRVTTWLLALRDEVAA